MLPPQPDEQPNLNTINLSALEKQWFIIRNKLDKKR